MLMLCRLKGRSCGLVFDTHMGKFFLTSCYISPISPRPRNRGMWVFKKLVEWALNEGLAVAVGEDFNGQHPLWDSNITHANSQGGL